GQLLSEGFVLAAVGGALGVLIAWWTGRTLSGFITEVLPVPVSFDFSIDRTVLGFALLASLGTAMLFGLAPALSASKPELVPALKDVAEGTGRGLLAGKDTDLGFDPAPISTLGFNLQMNGYDVERASALRDEALTTLRGLP